MKKLISILLVAVMLVAMVPATGLTISATTTPPTTKWTDEGNYDVTPFNGVDVTGNLSGQSFYIDTAAELAGLAYLQNEASALCFVGSVIYITDDIDLSAHQWVPIGLKGKFGGSIVGAKGITENATINAAEESKTNVFNNDTYSVNISNLYIDNSGTASNDSIGFIGQFAGDWLVNMNLVNATIIAKTFTAGSFVGRQSGALGTGKTNGYVEGGYVNLESDADITLTGGNTDKYDDIGGIVGIVNSGSAQTADTNPSNPHAKAVFDGCVFTGTIDAPKGDNVGGIIGLYQTNVGTIISDCVVISDKLAAGVSNYHSDGAGDGERNSGLGGIAGGIYSNVADDTSSASVTNCYVAANIVVYEPSNAEKPLYNASGMVGFDGNNAIAFENCQFDGIIYGSAIRTSAITGRNAATKTISNTVVSGIVFDATGTQSVYAYDGGGRVMISNSFNAMGMKTSNGSGMPMPAANQETDYSVLDNTIWNKTAYDMPVLAIAVPYLAEDAYADNSVLVSGVELGWFDPAANFNNVATVAQLDALAMIFDLIGEENSAVLAKKLIVADTLMNADLSGYSENARTNIQLACGIDVNATFDKTKIDIQFAQMAVAANVNNEKPQFNGTYNVRVVAKMNDATLANVYFDYKLTQDGNVTKQSGENPVKITTCHREVITIVNGVETRVSADNGYYVVFDIQNVSFAEIQNTELAVRVYATGADGTVYYSGQYVDIVLAVPAN